MRSATTLSIILLIIFAGCATPGTDGERVTTCEGAATAATVQDLPGGPPPSAAADAVDVQLGEEVVIGSLLPLTGALAAYGPDMENAVRLAVEGVNNASLLTGGLTVRLVTGDEKSDPAQAPNEFQRLLQEGIVAVIGAAGSGVTGSFLPAAVENEIVLVTPASTSPALSARENEGFFFRVPPSDAFQGAAMAQLLWDDGCRTLNILAVNNDYGTGFAGVLSDVFEEQGGAVGRQVLYNENPTSIDTELGQATTGGFDALVYIGYPGEATPGFRGLLQRGRLGDFPIYFSEGVKTADFVTGVGNDAGGLAGLRGYQGTTPAASETTATDQFQARYSDRFDGDEPGLFAAESYDAAIYVLLAIQSAASSDPNDFKSHMARVANPPGLRTSDLAQALTLLAAGQDIDWVGAASDLSWDDRGDPTTGFYAFWEVLDDGTIEEGEAFEVRQ